VDDCTEFSGRQSRPAEFTRWLKEVSLISMSIETVKLFVIDFEDSATLADLAAASRSWRCTRMGQSVQSPT
jgi:hypothetical protein